MDHAQGVARRHLAILAVTVIVLVLLAMTLVLIVDPLWLGQHENRLNRHQETYDERLTKTLRLTYGVPTGSFNAVLLGSSRASYLPADRFRQHRVFNFAVSSLYPGEYMSMLETFAREQGEPRAIIIGADFFSSRNDWEDRIGPYLRDAESPTFVLSKLFSVDTVVRSFNIARHNLKYPVPKNGDEEYDRQMRKAFHSGEGHVPYYKPMLRKYCRVVYGPSYTWNKSLPDYYAALLARFPHSRFLVYTSPTMGVLYDALVHSGRFEDYARWLTLLVRTYGEVRDLMGHNAFTDNPANYYDYHHFAAEGGAWLVDHALEAETPAIGARVTPANLERYLRQKRDEAESILKTHDDPCAEFR